MASTAQKIDPIANSVQQAQFDARSLTPVQKAAIIIALLGPQNAKPLIRSIEERHMRAFVEALQNLSLVPRPVLLATIADFVSHMNAREGAFRGGQKKARELAESLLDSDRVSRLFSSDAMSNMEPTRTSEIWEKLANEKSSKIAEYLDTQRPEMVNIVLSNLSPAKAGEILAEMDVEKAKAGGYLMAEGSNADDETLAAIAEVIELELLSEGGGEENGNAASFMAEVMGVLPRGRRDKLMNTIEEKNPAQAERIRKGLLTFEDLPRRLPKSAIPMIFRDMDAKTLTQALKSGEESDPMVTGFLYGNISQRMAEQFKSDVEGMSNLTEKDGEAAIIALMGYITGLERDGAIVFIEVSDAAPSMADFEMDINPEVGADDGGDE